MGFLNPGNLIYGLGLVLLVLIYLRSRARPTIDVSSLILFEAAPAPVAKSRLLRLDLLFWLEALTLGALTLALAGLYVRRAMPVGVHRSRALVFDLGAGMSAVYGSVTRLDLAKKQALEVVGDAPAGDDFSVIGYDLEAETMRAHSTNKSEVRRAIAALAPAAVAVRPAALRAALIDARGAATIDLFADRPPPPGLVDEARPDSRVNFHQVGGPADNLAIVALDAGVPRTSEGRCVVRNFSMRPQQCDLRIDAGGREVFHSPLILEPRAQMIVPFGPLAAGGLVHARILTSDALAADNDRYALAPSIVQARALVMSPEAEVRDDLARVVLAVNPNFLVTAVDTARFVQSKAAAQTYDLAVLHDCDDRGVRAAAKLFVFPEPRLDRDAPAPLLTVTGSVALAEFQSRTDTAPLTAPVLLGPARLVQLPGWMDPLARGASAGGHDSFPLAATGRNAAGEAGVITFDIRDHLLLDPDRMDALVLTIDTLRAMLVPPDLKVVPTGTSVAVSAFGRAVLVSPGGSRDLLAPDQWGRVHFRPRAAGRYFVIAGSRTIEVAANYYDAAESDLAAIPPPTPPHATPRAPNAPVYREVRAAPATMLLVVIALIFILAESALILRQASRWGLRHV
ncbi:MAG TPA: BatA domain-containing protein [Candidatus Binataceae bacterium]|nr:BatA domain-containing protein [Candidatus Binataceae bacterium]